MSEVTPSPHPTGPHGVCKENFILFVFTCTVAEFILLDKKMGPVIRVALAAHHSPTSVSCKDISCN